MDEGVGLMREKALARSRQVPMREQHLSETVVTRRPQAQVSARVPKLITYSRAHRTYRNIEFTIEVEFIAAHVPSARRGQILPIDPFPPHH
jgi:hypothetical protein